MRRTLATLTVALLAIIPAATAFAQEEGPVSASVNNNPKGYTAAYVIEASTGRVLFEENSHQPMPTASMATKRS
jgi:D-alanyl-D-alanine carboxypeptidase